MTLWSLTCTIATDVLILLPEFISSRISPLAVRIPTWELEFEQTLLAFFLNLKVSPSVQRGGEGAVSTFLVGLIRHRSRPSYSSSYYRTSHSTRLNVPIDYSNEDGAKADLVVINLSGRCQTEYKGTVIMNSGGPGGTDVSTFVSAVLILVELVI
ncbi:uncharacterized protein ARMOST_21568 [Armillaria ostoyae]|uniref:Uncharacterized protein n=1 Tax=Armillaria ostoyae TaxID=47428 RepID=A0A284SAF4_ARMOS|nr:uncharacterized protein ARMOST_21568 [Armillaria ostoyae]